MAIVKAFNGIRPKERFVARIAALPYDVMDSDEAREMVKGNPYSFLHVDKAEIDLDKATSIYDDKVYDKAKENLDKLIDNVYIEDEKQCMYIYKQKLGEREQTGLVVCSAIDDYINDVIKKHEFTRSDKELDRIKHIDKCNANTGLIFLVYRRCEEIANIINNWIINKPIYNFISDDGNEHTVWIIDDEKIITKIETAFKEVKNLYIADGHHRAASAVKVAKGRRDNEKSYSGNEEFNYFLSILYPDDELRILDYNRVVKDLNRLKESEFFKRLEEKFIIVPQDSSVKPEKKHSFGMYLNKNWYILEAKKEICEINNNIDRLDVSILQNNILGPILGIEDPRTSNRIEFVGGSRGVRELEMRVDGNRGIAFSMFPTTIEEVMVIADNGEVMPPKSTWFEPKPLSGIIIHKFD